ncbi:MAG: hypothetical protein LUE27_06510 [Clostridia bacterium]|nr:hypothetical protein [Clostridia bacterium]
MTEEEYIKVLKRKYSRSERKIREEINDCKRTAEEQGASVEEIYDARAEFYNNMQLIKPKLISYDQHFLYDPKRHSKNNDR